MQDSRDTSADEPQGMVQAGNEQMMPIAKMKAQFGALQELMAQLLVEGTDYGKFPGVDKPSLFLPGAEKIKTQFMLEPQYEVVSCIKDPDYIEYDVRCTLYSMVTGYRMGAMIRSANSNEEKWSWRKSIADAEWEATSPDRRRVKIRRAKGGGTYEEKQVRMNPYDMMNTIEAMACKRAFVAAVRQCTAASSIFTDSVEDMPPEVRGEVGQSVAGSTSEKKVTDKMIGKIHILMSRLNVPKDESARREYAEITLKLAKGAIPHIHGMTMEQGIKLIGEMDKLVEGT